MIKNSSALLLFCAALTVSITRPAFAGMRDLTLPPAPLENFEADPRAAAMGDATSASGNTPLSLLRNPAGIANMQNNALGLSHVSSGGILHESLAYAQPAGYGFSCGLGVDLFAADPKNEGGVLFDAAFAGPLSGNTALGLGFKSMQRMTNKTIPSINTMDIGLNHRWKNVTTSLTVKNLGNTDDSTVSPYGREYITAAAVELPFPVQLDGEIRFSETMNPQPAVGLELPFADRDTTGFLRGGWQPGPDESPDGRFTAGIGVDYEKSLLFDYAINASGPFGPVQKFSLTLRFGTDSPPARPSERETDEADTNTPAKPALTREQINQKLQDLLKRTQQGEKGLLPEIIELTNQSGQEPDLPKPRNH